MLTKTQRAVAHALARVQRETLDPPGWEFDLAIAYLAQEFAATNRRFSRAQFEAACHVNSSPAVIGG